MEIEIFLPEPGTAFIYKLVDPRDGAIRYIGVTNNPANRFAWHINNTYCGKNKQAWIKELKALGLHPRMFIIERCPESDRFAREHHWIKKHLLDGHKLVNVYDPNGRYFAGEPKSESTVIDLPEACQILGVSRYVFCKRMAAGKITPLPGYNCAARMRARYRFNRADIEALKAGQPHPARTPETPARRETS